MIKSATKEQIANLLANGKKVKTICLPTTMGTRYETIWTFEGVEYSQFHEPWSKRADGWYYEA